MMREILNDFELDWACVPNLPEKYDLAQLKDKTVLVCGHAAARCMVYSLLYFNDEKNLNISVITTGKTSRVLRNYHPEILSRADFTFCTPEQLRDLDSVDYIIDFGFCNERYSGMPEDFTGEISLQRDILDFAKGCGVRQVVLVSDSRVYGKPRPYRIYSEGEASGACFENDKADGAAEILRTIETLWACGRRESDFCKTVLRTGMLLGADAKLNSPFEKVFDSVANSQSCTLYNSSEKVTLTYISDALNAVYLALAHPENDAVYNICEKSCTLSTGEITAALKNIYGDKCKINLSNLGGEDFCYAPICGNKGDFCGYESKISAPTALELCVMSYCPQPPCVSPLIHSGRLPAVQKILLGLLMEVDRICRKHNIKYFLGGGTLLGAIRHEGFIPWDDDADIMMLRQDYDRFLQVAPSELKKGLTLQSNKYDRDCHYEFSKIRLDNTMFATVFSREHKNMHNGLSLDIFCHDNTANSSLGRKLHINATLFFRALVFNKWNHRKIDNGKKFASLFSNICKALFPLGFSQFMLNRIMCLFKNKKNPAYLYDGMGRNIYNGAFPADYLKEAVYVDFENRKLPVPAEYSKYLEYLYGDYSKLPPLSKRIQCHDILLFDLGEYGEFCLSPKD